LNFVRALIHNPELLFLDEPTAGIDPSNARSVKTVIESRQDDGKTIFLTTHDMTVADELCDRVAFIVDGQLAVIDTPRSLKLEHGAPTVRIEYRTDSTLERQQFPITDLGANETFQEVLGSGRVETIHTDEATLEEVFIEVTGTALR
jgi:fluoroquinolone transport system ATP-binding protein